MSKILSFLFFLASGARVWFDWKTTISQAAPFRFSDIGTVWGNFHTSSFETFGGIFTPILTLPLAPVLFGLSLLFWLIGRRKR